jgi:hypothetical protein
MPAQDSIGPGNIISRALSIYGEQAGVLIPAALVVFAVDAVLALALRGVLAILAALVGLVATTFYNGMVVELVRDVQDDRRDSTAGDLFRAVRPVVAPLIAVSILGGIGIFIGFVLIIIPGLILITIWSVVAPVTVLERPGVFAAFGRSRELVRGHGWQVFGVLIVIILIAIVASIIVGAVAHGLGNVGETIVSWIVNVLTAPLSALLTSVLYFALRRAHGDPSMSSGVARPEGAPTWSPPTPGEGDSEPPRPPTPGAGDSEPPPS